MWEFSRLNIQCCPLSKRKLLALVNTKTVSGWDDPRISTINGLRCVPVRCLCFTLVDLWHTHALVAASVLDVDLGRIAGNIHCCE